MFSGHLHSNCFLCEEYSISLCGSSFYEFQGLLACPQYMFIHFCLNILLLELCNGICLCPEQDEMDMMGRTPACLCSSLQETFKHCSLSAHSKTVHLLRNQHNYTACALKLSKI